MPSDPRPSATEALANSIEHRLNQFGEVLEYILMPRRWMQQVVTALRAPAPSQTQGEADKPPNLMDLYRKVVNVLRAESDTHEQELAIGQLFDEFTAEALKRKAAQPQASAAAMGGRRLCKSCFGGIDADGWAIDGGRDIADRLKAAAAPAPAREGD